MLPDTVVVVDVLVVLAVERETVLNENINAANVPDDPMLLMAKTPKKVMELIEHVAPDGLVTSTLERVAAGAKLP